MGTSLHLKIYLRPKQIYYLVSTRSYNAFFRDAVVMEKENEHPGFFYICLKTFSNRFLNSFTWLFAICESMDTNDIERKFKILNYFHQQVVHFVVYRLVVEGHDL